MSCDAWELDSAFQAGDLSRVASLYAGPFLDSVHVRGSVELDQLLDAERTRLTRVWAEGTESLARAARERALELLGAGLDEANRFTVPAIREYPELAPLRGEKRFEQLLALR